MVSSRVSVLNGLIIMNDWRILTSCGAFCCSGTSVDTSDIQTPKLVACFDYPDTNAQ